VIIIIPPENPGSIAAASSQGTAPWTKKEKAILEIAHINGSFLSVGSKDPPIERS
jgi:hypothetical protein